MIRNKIHLIRPGCLRPSIALTVQNRGLKHHSFIRPFIHDDDADLFVLLPDVNLCSYRFTIEFIYRLIFTHRDIHTEAIADASTISFKPNFHTQR